MLASEIMTKDVVAARPDTPLPEIARLLVEHGISALPVVDQSGAVIGMVSEGDLIHRGADEDREKRRDWWLTLLAEGEALHPEFLATLKSPDRTAEDVMNAPVVTVDEHAEAREIAKILNEYHIKRVPVVRDGKMIGIVSRADLLRAFAMETAPTGGATPRPHLYDRVGGVLSKLDQRFLHGSEVRGAEEKGGAAGPKPSAAEPRFSAQDFKQLVVDYDKRESVSRNARERSLVEQRQKTVQAMIDAHIAEEGWKSILNQAREAAEHGAKEFMLLRFPCDLCSDGGRAINAPLADWPKTLRGEAAEIYMRWERDLRSRGFHLTARILDFPDGKPGDAGLFLSWEG